MSQFVVTEVSDKVRSYDTEHGAKKAYRVHLRNGDGTDHLNIELRKNATSPPPVVGQSFEGDLIDQGQYGQRLQVSYGGGGGGSGGGSKEYKADPAKQAAIAMEHAQKAAIDILSLAAERAEGYSLPDTVTGIAGIASQVCVVAKQLYDQIAEVSGAAS